MQGSALSRLHRLVWPGSLTTVAAGTGHVCNLIQIGLHEHAQGDESPGITSVYCPPY